MRDIYQQILMDHFKNPRRHCPLTDYDACMTGANPMCGDSVTLYVKRCDGDLVELSFEGKGCAISQASASIMVDCLHGKTVAVCREVSGRFREMIRGNGSVGGEEEYKDLAALGSMHRYPARMKCALLAWEALDDFLSACPPAGANQPNEGDKTLSAPHPEPLQPPRLPQSARENIGKIEGGSAGALGQAGWLERLRMESAAALLPINNTQPARSELAEALATLPSPVRDANPASPQMQLVDAQILWDEIRRQGGYIGRLEDALRSKASLLQRYLGTLTRQGGKWPEWLNMARWQTGNLVHIPPNATPHFVVEAPLRAARGQDGEAVTRTLLIVDKGAQVTYVEGCAAREERTTRDGMRLATSEIFVAAGARLDFVSLIHLGGTIRDRSRKFIRLEAGAHLVMTEVIIDPGDTITPPLVQLGGGDASLTYRQLLVLSRGQTMVPLGIELADAAASQPGAGQVTIKARLVAGGGSSATCDRLQLPPGIDANLVKWRADLKAVLWDTGSSLRLAEKSHDDWQEQEFDMTPLADPAPHIAELCARGITPREAKAQIGEAIAADILADLPLEYAVEIRRFFLME